MSLYFVFHWLHLLNECAYPEHGFVKTILREELHFYVKEKHERIWIFLERKKTHANTFEDMWWICREMYLKYGCLHKHNYSCKQKELLQYSRPQNVLRFLFSQHSATMYLLKLTVLDKIPLICSGSHVLKLVMEKHNSLSPKAHCRQKEYETWIFVCSISKESPELLYLFCSREPWRY